MKVFFEQNIIDVNVAENVEYNTEKIQLESQFN